MLDTEQRKSAALTAILQNSIHTIDPSKVTVERIIGTEALKTIVDLLQPAPSGWQTMDSAPRDGEYILAVRNEAGYSKKRPTVIQWDGDLSNWTDGCGNEVVSQPTHWHPIKGLPLPSPPTGEKS